MNAQGTISSSRRHALVAEWRELAEHYHGLAGSYRRDGDSEYAAELDLVASDYTDAADRLAYWLGGLPPELPA